MKFCKECGSELKPHVKFCPACGSAVSHGGQQDNQQSTTNRPAPQPIKPKTPWTKKQKRLGIGTIAIIILLSIGYQIGASLTSEKRLVQNFSEALEEGDAGEITKLLSKGEKNLDVNEQNVNRMIEFLENNPSYYDYVMDTLLSQTEKSSDSVQANTDDYPAVFSVAKTGKTGLIFDRYEISVLPFYLNIHTNYAGTKILVDGEEVAISDSGDFSIEHGPLMPGTYPVKAVYQDDYTTLETSRTVDLADPNSTVSSLDLYLEGESVSFHAENMDIAQKATLFINGKKAGQLEESFGPVSMDGSQKAYAELEFPWGTIKTKETAIEDNYLQVEAESILTEEAAQAIQSALYQYAQDWADAYRSLDESKFTNTTDQYMEYVEEDFSSMRDYDRKWKGEFTKGLVDEDSYSLSTNEDGQYLVSVNTSLFYDSATYDEGEDPSTSVNENNWNYTLVYDEDSEAWLIDDYYSLYFGFEMENSKRIDK
ncbi:zinc ribbon domain-containing protein [Sediminibacillus albus]|uniref:Uncharacterized membrane protein YvbJ n=1 Tax=Sediminibacillus albus TaxID=407036 RepID=A0A1G8ZFH8_9BACI|nr:zinc-ribbon domain-containing protein [Sediminibacillus albus]SDK13862.1 Uncharacterized membrane protein YvbJ [Sediminibacillus albus]